MKKESITIKIRAAGSKYATAETTNFVRGIRVGTIVELPVCLFPYAPKKDELFTIAIREFQVTESE